MGTWITAALLWLGALRLHKAGSLGPAAAHLCVLLCALMALSAAAMVNLLQPAAWLLFGGIAAATVLDMRRQGIQTWLAGARAFLTRPVCLALLAGAVLTLVYAIQQPVFTYWDEYYIWGINAKVLHYSHHLYTVGPYAGGVYYPCGAPMLGYLFQFFCPQFVEADLYLSYGYFYFAVFAAAAELVQRRAGAQTATLFFAALTLSPFLQGYHEATPDYLFISYGYATSMADYLLGVGMFACIVLYLAAPDTRWYYAALAYTSFIKETGVLPAALAVLVIALWRWAAADQTAPRRARLAGWAVRTLQDLMLPAGCYLAWLLHVSVVAGNRSTSPAVGVCLAAVLAAALLAWQRATVEQRQRCQAAARRLGAVFVRRVLPVAVVLGMALAAWLLLSGSRGLLAQRLRALLRLAAGFFIPALRGASWRQTLGIMWQSFRGSRTLLLCRDIMLVALLCAAVLAAALLCGSRRQGWLLLATQAVWGLGALVYLYVLSYFVADFLQTMGMVEYGRYFSTYLYAWVYTVALLVLLRLPRGWLPRAAALGGAAVYMAALVRLGPDHTVLMAPQNYRESANSWLEMTAPVRATVQAGDHLYIVFQSLDSGNYLRAIYYLYPALAGQARVDTDIDYSIIYCTERDPNDPYSQYYHIASEEEFRAMLQKNFEYVFVIGGVEGYQKDYGALFEGGVAYGAFYRVTDEATTPLRRIEGVAP